MLTYEGLDHVALRVREMAPMLKFYVDVLGCKPIDENKQKDLYLLRAGDALVVLHAVADAPMTTRREHLDHLCLRVAEFDAGKIGKHLKTHGVDCGTPVLRDGATGETQALYIRDPEGNVVELKASRDHP